MSDGFSAYGLHEWLTYVGERFNEGSLDPVKTGRMYLGHLLEGDATDQRLAIYLGGQLWLSSEKMTRFRGLMTIKDAIENPETAAAALGLLERVADDHREFKDYRGQTSSRSLQARRLLNVAQGHSALSDRVATIKARLAPLSFKLELFARFQGDDHATTFFQFDDDHVARSLLLREFTTLSDTERAKQKHWWGVPDAWRELATDYLAEQAELQRQGKGPTHAREKKKPGEATREIHRLLAQTGVSHDRLLALWNRQAVPAAWQGIHIDDALERTFAAGAYVLSELGQHKGDIAKTLASARHFRSFFRYTPKTLLTIYERLRGSGEAGALPRGAVVGQYDYGTTFTLGFRVKGEGQLGVETHYMAQQMEDLVVRHGFDLAEAATINQARRNFRRMRELHGLLEAGLIHTHASPGLAAFGFPSPTHFEMALRGKHTSRLLSSDVLAAGGPFLEDVFADNAKFWWWGCEAGRDANTQLAMIHAATIAVKNLTADSSKDSVVGFVLTAEQGSDDNASSLVGEFPAYPGSGKPRLVRYRNGLRLPTVPVHLLRSDVDNLRIQMATEIAEHAESTGEDVPVPEESLSRYLQRIPRHLRRQALEVMQQWSQRSDRGIWLPGGENNAMSADAFDTSPRVNPF